MTNEQTEVMVIEAEYVQLGAVKVSSPADVVRRAADIASELANVIKKQNLSVSISGRDFVRVEGWSTLGAMLGILPREVPESVIRHEDGTYEATVELIRTTDGAVIGRGSAICGMDELWGKRKEFARRSMAITRATGKAYRLGFSWIMTLAGYEPTPAEEMTEVVEGKQKEPQRKAKQNPRQQNNTRPATIKEVWDRWNVVWNEAKSLGIEVDALPAKSTREQIYESGKALAASIEAVKQLSAQTLTAIVEAGLTENPHSAINTLKHSTLPPSADTESVTNWFRQYRAARDSDASVEDAAALANAWLAGEVDDLDGPVSQTADSRDSAL